MRCFWVYILTNKPRGTLYIGVTNGLIRRVDMHRAGIGSEFTKRYSLHLLAHLEAFANIREAIQREKTLKEWPRDWKLNLIERGNPNWADLYPLLPGVKPISKL